MMKLTTLILVILATAPNARADDSDWMEKRIQQGDWNVGGGGNVFYSSENGLTGYASASAQYFFWRHVSFGLQTNYVYTKYGESSGLGLVGTYYFYETKKKAFYFSQSFDVGHYNSKTIGPHAGMSANVISAQSSLGYQHFFTPTISSGPELRYRYYLEKNGAPNLPNDVGVLLNFKLFF